MSQEGSWFPVQHSDPWHLITGDVHGSGANCLWKQVLLALGGEYAAFSTLPENIADPDA